MKRPYIVINFAMSSDGKIASPSGKQFRISCDEDIKRMYELRNRSDAVLVGINTVLSDNPKLTVKEKYVKNPKQPIRIVLDTNCRIPVDFLLLDDKAKSIIVSKNRCKKEFGDNIENLICKLDENGLIDLNQLLTQLYNKGIKKLMVEGGAKVINNFLKLGYADDIFVYYGPMIIGGKKTPKISDKAFDEEFNLKIISKKSLGPGFLYHYRLIK